jgi:zinc protease
MLREERLSQETMDRAKNLMQVEYHRGKQSLMSRSSEASDLLTYSLPHDYQQTMIEKAMQLSPHDLAGVSNQYLIWDRAYTLMVKPEQ